MQMFINTIKVLFSHGLSDKKEGTEFILLLRIQSLIYCLYFLILSVLLAANQHYILTFIALFGCAVLCVAYISTMANHLRLSLILLASCFWSISCLLSIFAGFDYHFYWIIVTLIPILYFNTTITIHENIPYASIIMLSVFTLFIIDLFQSNTLLIPNQAILILNMIVLLLSLVSSAFLGKERFRNSENQIILANERLRSMANLDSLTQLYNRRAMNRRLLEASLSYTKSQNPFCIAIGDIDFFKKINDNYGHDAGDAILIAIAEMFISFMEKRGYIARWGGEEFLFCFTNVELKDAAKQLERLRELINQHEFHFQDKTILLTMTFGIEIFQEHLGVENTISRADEKLYEGKASGRNRVIS